MLLVHSQPATEMIPSRDTFDARALSFVDNLYGAARHLARNPADAEDLVQDTYVKAFRFADRFHSGTDLKAWLFTILYNTHRNVRRQASRDRVSLDSNVVEQAAAPSDPRATPEHRLMRMDDAREVRAALASLPDRFREAIWLRDVEELSYLEIAQALSIPVGTVMSRISRGRRLLFERLTDGAVSRPGSDRQAG